MTPLPFCRYGIVRQRDPKKRGKEIIKLYNNPLFGRFSISSEILIDFGLTLFMVSVPPADTGRNEVRSPFRKARNLIAENRKQQQIDKP